jgi:Tol biopolymer transport system component
MMGVRAGLAAALSGVVVAGLVNAPPVTGAGVGMGAQAPPLAAVSARASVQVPVSTGKRPTVRLRSTTRLVVDIDPNLSGTKVWKFVLKRRTATGEWERVGVYRTRGAAEIRRLRVEPGTYRVRVRARHGYRAVTTRAYQHTPSVVTTRVSVRFDGGRITRGRSALSSISGDGRWIAFTSAAPNLVTDDTNKKGDVFLFDRRTRQTRRVSVRSDGGQATGGRSAYPAISADGRWITYTSKATNLVDDDTNGTWDVFLFDRDTGTTQRVSVRSDGGQATGTSRGQPAISGDGRWITYSSAAADLVADDTNEESDVFLFDRDTGTTQRVSVRSDGGQANGGSGGPAISADGRWITYTSAARNLVADDTNRRADVFLFDRDIGTTRRVSVRTGGGQFRYCCSYDPAISADGRWITYTSGARNLVADDTNGRDDVFLFDRDTGTTRRVSVRTGGGQFRSCCGSRALGDSYGPAISADGRWVTYSVYVEATYTDPDRWGLITDVFLTRMW